MQLRDYWGGGVNLRRRVDDHIFREHKTEADALAEKGVKGRQDEWEDDSKLVVDCVVSGMGAVSVACAEQV